MFPGWLHRQDQFIRAGEEEKEEEEEDGTTQGKHVDFWKEKRKICG